MEGGHVIKLGKGNDEAAKAALGIWPGGLQIGGGINETNAQEWLDAGASKVRPRNGQAIAPTEFASRVYGKVIVTSYLFPEAKFSLERLQKISSIVGKDRLVVDVRRVLWKSLIVVESNFVVAAGRGEMGGSLQ